MEQCIVANKSFKQDCVTVTSNASLRICAESKTGMCTVVPNQFEPVKVQAQFMDV
jgi:hypothetical protein